MPQQNNIPSPEEQMKAFLARQDTITKVGTPASPIESSPSGPSGFLSNLTDSFGSVLPPIHVPQTEAYYSQHPNEDPKNKTTADSLSEIPLVGKAGVNLAKAYLNNDVSGAVGAVGAGVLSALPVSAATNKGATQAVNKAGKAYWKSGVTGMATAKPSVMNYPIGQAITDAATKVGSTTVAGVGTAADSIQAWLKTHPELVKTVAGTVGGLEILKILKDLTSKKGP